MPHIKYFIAVFTILRIDRRDSLKTAPFMKSKINSTFYELRHKIQTFKRYFQLIERNRSKFNYP